MRIFNDYKNRFTLFRQKEREAINASKASIHSITALFGLTSLSVFMWQGISWGYQLGASSVFAGALTGGTGGAIIGGVIAAVLCVALIAIVYFKLSKWLLQAWRRISSGSEAYRFLKHESKQDIHNEISNMMTIAQQLKTLQNNEMDFIRHPQIYEGLTPLQQKLFKNIFALILKSKTTAQAELALTRSKLLHDLRKLRQKELLQMIRSLKAYAIVQYKQNPHIIPENIQDGIPPGRSPWAIFHKIRNWFYPSKHLASVGSHIPLLNAIPANILEHQPHHTLANPRRLIYSLLQLEPSKLGQFSETILNKEANDYQQLPATIYREILRQNVIEQTAVDSDVKERAENEMSYLVGNVYRDLQGWFNQDKTFTQPVPSSSLIDMSEPSDAADHRDLTATSPGDATIQFQQVSKAPANMSYAELMNYHSYLKSEQANSHHTLKMQRNMAFEIARTEKLMSLC